MKSITTKVLIAVALGAYVLSSGCSKVEEENAGGKKEGSQQEMVSKLRRAAERGDVAAQYNIGCMYADGKGVLEDDKAAVKWFQKAAEQGYADAQFNLGCMYANGEGVPEDNSEAVKWYRKAAEQGLAEAQVNLGNMYDEGEGVPEDDSEAVKWYRKAADQGYASAQLNLGYMYAKGEGVPEGEACIDGDRLYLHSDNSSEAVKWYRKAAEQGNAFAQYNLGNMYANGKGVPKNDSEAVKWYRKAAEQGYASAQCNLGIMYAKGEGVPEDDEEAVKWYRKAAQQGHTSSQYNLGVMYDNGKGVPENDVEAYKWYLLAAAQGGNSAKHNKEIVRKRMSSEQIAEAQRRASTFRVRKASVGAESERGLEQGEMEPRGNGTGFFITSNGYLLTNYHVVEDAGEIKVQTSQGALPAKLVNADPANDIAVLKVRGRFLALSIAASRKVKLGDSVFTVGFPNITLQGMKPKLTKGNINSLAGIRDNPRYFQISVPIQPGNSGGPLVNEKGNVIGVVVSSLSDLATLETTGTFPQNVNYAVKSSFVLAALEAIPQVGVNLKEPVVGGNRPFRDVAAEAEAAVVMILVY